MTDHEKRKALAVLKMIMMYRDRLRQLGRPQHYVRQVLIALVEKKVEYHDLCLAWRALIAKGGVISEQTADQMKEEVIDRLLQAPYKPAPGEEEPIPLDRLGYFRKTEERGSSRIPRAEALSITHQWQELVTAGQFNMACSIALTMRGQGYTLIEDEIISAYGVRGEVVVGLVQKKAPVVPQAVGVPLKVLYTSTAKSA